MKTIIQRFSDRGLLDIDTHADEILKEFLLIERGRPGLEELNDDVVIQ